MLCVALFYFLLTVSCATAAHLFFVRFLSLFVLYVDLLVLCIGTLIYIEA